VERLRLFANSAIRDLFVLHLEMARERFGFQLAAWVIMPEHVHLLLIPRAVTVRRLLRTLKGGFAQRVIDRWKEIDAPILKKIRTARGGYAFWQPGGGYDRNIWSNDEWREKLAYIHRNPVKRGLVRRPVDWRWSSARWYAGLRDEIAVLE
jgi:putative transposase